MVNLKNIISPTKNKVVLIVIAIVLTLGLLFVLEKTGIINFYNKTPESSSAKTTSDARSAQADFNINEMGDDKDDGGRRAGNTLREDEGSAGARDTSGDIDQSIDTSNPIESATGEITLYTPKRDSSVKNNQIVVAGASTLDSVMYRISDNVSGLLTMGSLKVVDGHFSGIITINTNGTKGQLDIFGTHADGNEFSNIPISLNFN